jgi:DNA polymerase family A
MRICGCSTEADKRSLGTDSLGIRDAKPPPRSASHSRMPSVQQGPYVRQCQKCQEPLEHPFGAFGTPLGRVFGKHTRSRRTDVEKLTGRINAPVQGTGADGLKLALALLWERRDECPRAVLVLVCHDEIVVECDEDRGEETKRWLEKAMIEGMDTVLNGTDEVVVPVEVEARIASSWGDGG